MRLIRLLKSDLAKEMTEWVDENLITHSQAEKICLRYGVDYNQIKNRSLGYNVLIGLGYLFIGLAIITVLGANWDNIPRWVRMCGLIALTMATQGFALRKYQSEKRIEAIGIFFLGNLFYGAAIILIAQMYHLGEHMPDGIFWWALGCLPLGIMIKSRLLILQSLLLALTWFFMEVNMGFYPTLFPLFIAGALITLYRGKQSIILFLLVVASIGFWIEYSLSAYWRDGNYYDFHAEHISVSVSMFVFAYAFSHWLSLKESVTAKDYGAILAVWSLRFGLVIMLIMSFEDPWEELLQANWQHTASMIVIVAAFSAATMLLAYKAKKTGLVICILSFHLLSLMAVLFSGDKDHAIYFQVIYNIALIATGGWLILRGILNGISHYFFLGIASILLTAFMRYVDLIGNYIGGAVLFMIFAGLLLGAAKYWKNYQLERE